MVRAGTLGRMDEKTREQMLQIAEAKQELRKPEPSKGLGDTIAKVTKAVGIKPCGPCERRRQWLNARVPYRGR